jgi:hypothetical protein
LRVPYLPHLVIGTLAAFLVIGAPGSLVGGGPASLVGGGPAVRVPGEPQRRAAWPPAPIRTRRFWLAVAPAAPLVFGSVSTAIVVLPEDVTSAKSLSAGFAGLITALAFAAGLGVQPVARRLTASTGLVAGLSAAAIGTAVGVAAVHGGDRVLAGLAAVFLGLAYGLCLVSGLRQAERLAGPADRGAVVACYYALAYVGFAAPYLAAGLGALTDKAGALAIMAGAAAALAMWTAGYTAIERRDTEAPERRDTGVARRRGIVR